MYTIAITNQNWFDFLSDKDLTEEVNFWTPTLWNPKIDPGSKWFFMLKSPIRKISGYGIYREYTELSITNTWEKYGEKNGSANMESLVSMLSEHIDPKNYNTHKIGSILLTDVVYYDKQNFILPETYNIDFPSAIMKYKKYDGEPNF
ncbi:MAG TPA: hypothetical protein PK559_14335 [Ignavibacteriaceae bacterium]|nr:hypothetical protein [Ignavibacteriaceae bacterium]